MYHTIVTLKKGEGRTLKAGGMWVYDNEIASITGDFENGDIVVAIINGNEATIKKGKKSDSSILLQPLNTAYEPLIFTKEEMKSIPVTIIGIVKQLKRIF